MTFCYPSQFLQPWILPPGLNLIIAIVGHVISRFSKRVGNGLIWIAFISFWLFSTPITALFLIDSLQNRYPRLNINEIKNDKTSAIIVLGGGSWTDKSAKNGYILSVATKDRLTYAAYLYHHTHVPIFISGGKSETKAMKDYFNVPVAWAEYKSINTRDESRYTLSILKKNNIQTTYLVTNAWHMTRSIYCFQQAFKNTNIKIIAAPMGYILRPDQGITNYFPSFDGLQISQTAMHEYVGILVYYLTSKSSYVLLW